MKYIAFTRFGVGAAACLAAAHICAQALPAATPDQVGMSSQRLARLSAVLKEGLFCNSSG